MTTTTISRLELDHPDLGTAGGAGLHAAIAAIYTKLGNNIGSRLFYAQGLANAATADFDHNFGARLVNQRWDLYLWNTGTQVLTRVTSTSSPALSAFTLIDRVGFEDTQVRLTNSSGSSQDLVLCLFNDPIHILGNDIADVDNTTAIQDGQSLVYDSVSGKLKPGASGDSSFKIQSVTTPNAVIKAGYYILEDGREIGTYDGSGSASTDYTSDLTVSLTTIFGSAPANATTYYLYIDLLSLGASVTLSDVGRRVYSITQSNFFLSTVVPAEIDRDRYIECGWVRSATSGTAWSGTGAAFGVTAFRQGIRITPDRISENLMVNPLFERTVTQGVTATSITAAGETSTPLVGLQSLKLTSTASTGTVDLDLKTIPPGYLGKFPLAFSGLFKVDSSAATGDWTVGIYNTTDSVYAAAAQSLVTNDTSRVVLGWIPQTGKTYKVRIAYTVTTASRVLLVDGLLVNSQPYVTQPIVGVYQSFTPSYTNLGGATTTFNTGFMYRDGEFLIGAIFTRWSAAGTGGQQVTWNLPTYGGQTITSKVTAAIHALGHASYNGVTGDFTTHVQGVLTAASGAIPLIGSGNSAVPNTQLSISYFGWTFHFKIPIAEWAATGVTVTPSLTPRATRDVDNTILGFAQTGAGTTRAVSSALAHAEVDTNGQYWIDGYLVTATSSGADTGTQYVSATMTALLARMSVAGVTDVGVTTEGMIFYASSTGGFRLHSEISSTTYGNTIWKFRVPLASKPTWFDTYVQAATASVAILESSSVDLGIRAIPNATLYLEGGSGHGSSNTKFRRWTTAVVNTLGTDATFAQSSTNGDSVTIVKPGVYFIQSTDARTAGVSVFGISISTAGTTNIQSATASDRLALTTTPSAAGGSVSACLYLAANAVVRGHDDGTPDETAAAKVNFRLTRIF